MTASVSTPQELAAGPALLAVAHGSADPRAAQANTRLLRQVATTLPAVTVRLAYLDHLAPSVPEALAALAVAGAREVVVLPLLLTVGYHSRTDIPALLHDPPLAVRYGRVLGPDRLLAAGLADRLTEAGVAPRTSVVLAAAGASDPDAARDVAVMADLLAAVRAAPVTPAYASAIPPTVPEALAAAEADAAVSRYFLAPGRLPDRVVLQAGPRLVGQPLNDHPALVRVVVNRYREVWTGSA